MSQFVGRVSVRDVATGEARLRAAFRRGDIALRGPVSPVGGPAMQNGKINRWVALAGFAVLVVGLGLEGLAIYKTYGDGDFIRSEQPSMSRPEPMLRFLFDRTS
jgi:hypothetical protein